MKTNATFMNRQNKKKTNKPTIPTSRHKTVTFVASEQFEYVLNCVLR